MSATNKNPMSLSADLNNFIYGVSRRNFQNAPDLTKTGISLLKNFPAARDAVLEYFSMVFHDAVNFTANQPEVDHDNLSSPSLEAVNMIGPDICALGVSWAPFVAPWCISLLKDIATNKTINCNVAIQTLDPVRVLLEIATQNLTLLKADERAKCIDLLLGSSQCEWVVGEVGRVEPWLVVPRALQLGLDAGLDRAVAILQHLPPTHKQHIRHALVHLFHQAIREETNMEKKKDIIPYLLNLAAKSDTVLKAFTQDIEEILTDEVVERLITISPLMRNIPSWEGVGPSSLVALLILADINSFFLLLKHAKHNLFCRQLLEYLLQKMEYECLFPDKKIPLLSSAAEQIDMVRERLLTGNQLEKYSIARIIILVSHQLSFEFVNTISFLLQYSRSDTTLALLVRIVSSTLAMHTPADSQDVNVENDRCHCFISDGVENALRNSMMSDTQLKRCFIEGNLDKDKKTYTHHFCLNISKLLRWENSNKVSHLRNRPISKACEANLYKLTCAFYDTVSLLRVSKPCTMSSLSEMPTASAFADVLDRLDISGTKSPPPSVEVVLKLVRATVKYFFRCLNEEDMVKKMQNIQTVCRLLRKICIHSQLGRAAALRELLEAAVLKENEIFDSLPTLPSELEKEQISKEFLIYLNQKHGTTTHLTQSHTSVFHAGIIGKGAKNSLKALKDGIPDIFTPHIELFMSVLMACMEGGGGIVEGMTSVSLLLVEFVSPDVVYNALPWPDEEFTKVSIERELYIRGSLERCAVARAGLRRAALCRPALCLASTLLRSVAATLLHRHRPLDRLTIAEANKEQAVMIDLLDTMAIGQLLPHPLSRMRQLVVHLTPIEIVQVLRDCLWNYTRDHVPSPALFTCDATGLHWRNPATSKPPSIYTDSLRIVIQRRISKLGHLYPLMFMNLEKVE